MEKGLSLFYTRKRARALLRRTHIAFLVALLCLLSAFAALGISLVVERVFSVLCRYAYLPSAASYLMAALLSLLFIVFLVSPLYRGTKAFVLGCVLYGRVDHSTIFSFYSTHRRYLYAVRRALSSVLRLVVSLVLSYAVLCIGRVLARYLLDKQDAPHALLVLCLTLVFFCLLLWIFWLASANRFAMDAVFLTSSLLSYRQIKALSTAAVRGRRRAIFKDQLLFAPYIIVSLLCFGFPLLFVLPYMHTTRALVASELLKK